MPLSVEARRFLDDHASHLAVIGGPTGADAEPPATVVAARILEGSRRVAVLAAEPPFVRVHRWDGAAEARFVGQGGAALEARMPLALGALGDDSLLLADATGRLSLYATDGRLLAQRSYAPLRAMGVLGACGDRWLVYGPGATSALGQVPWLHVLPAALDGPPRAVELLEPPVPGETHGFGKAHGLVSGVGGAVLRHDYGPDPRVVTWSCAPGAPPESLFALARPRTAGAKSRGEALALSVDPDAPIAVGIAALYDGVLLADYVVDGRGAERTELTLVRGSARRRLAVAGPVFIRDSRPGLGVLFETNAPASRLVLVAERRLVELFDAEGR